MGTLDLKRSPVKRKTALRPISAKRRAYRSSKDGKEALKYMEKVKSLPCVICLKPGPSDAHHVICGRYGTSKASDLDVIPLCKAHHQDGPEAIHNGKASWVEKHGPDWMYLDLTKRWLDAL